LILPVRVIPRASKSAIAGHRGDAVLVRLSAPPVEGAANEALVDLLARAFSIPRRQISIVSGEKSRDKRVAIEGLTEQDVSARLSAILNGER
jgi:uncharacterized protein (TIGR00251 family)